MTRGPGLAELRDQDGLWDKMVFQKVLVSHVKAQTRRAACGFLHSEILLGSCCGSVTELGFGCSLLKNPTLRDKCWVKGKTALWRKLAIWGEHGLSPKEPTPHR